MAAIEVNLPQNGYRVTVELGALERLGAVARACAPHARALLAVDEAIEQTHGRRAKASLESAGYHVATIALRADEREKSLATVKRIYDAMLAAGLERKSPVGALGGGIVGDTAGFAAATFLRGVPLIHAPTTLLAMVDASIGGKTGVNIELPGGRNLERGDAAAGRTPAPALGKNLIGAFWQPVAVVADPLVLQTLPPREYRSGVAECIKHAIIADAAHFAFLEENAEAIARAEPQAVQTLIEQSARIKIGIVEQDERESGIRALLNLGHTFAHAIESMHELDVRHGEAVAIGLIAAGRCAVATGRLGERDLERIESLVKQFDLPHELPAAAPIEALMQAMSFDKKVIGGRLRLVLPTRIGAAEVTDDVPPEIVRDAWRKAGAR